MAVLYGSTGRLTAQNGHFRPGQIKECGPLEYQAELDGGWLNPSEACTAAQNQISKEVNRTWVSHSTRSLAEQDLLHHNRKLHRVTQIARLGSTL